MAQGEQDGGHGDEHDRREREPTPDPDRRVRLEEIALLHVVSPIGVDSRPWFRRKATAPVAHPTTARADYHDIQTPDRSVIEVSGRVIGDPITTLQSRFPYTASDSEKAASDPAAKRERDGGDGRPERLKRRQAARARQRAPPRAGLAQPGRRAQPRAKNARSICDV